MLSLDQMVADDSFVRIIDLFVDAMLIKELGFKHAKLNPEGNLPYHPRDMFKLCKSLSILGHEGLIKRLKALIS